MKRVPASYYNKYRASKLRETLESQERERYQTHYH